MRLIPCVLIRTGRSDRVGRFLRGRSWLASCHCFGVAIRFFASHGDAKPKSLLLCNISR